MEFLLSAARFVVPKFPASLLQPGVMEAVVSLEGLLVGVACTT